MQHYHYTNIAHPHTVTDYGHYHKMSLDTEGNYEIHRGDPTGSNYNSVAYRYTTEAGLYYAGRAYTGVSVNPLSEADGWKYSQGAVSDGSSTPRTKTDSNNTSATETRPTNFTVKIWKRTA